MHSTLRIAGLATALLLLPAAAQAQNCTIKSLPHTITAPGTYCLKDSLTAAGDGITIAADDVVLDLGGLSIVGSGTGLGVQASNHNNVTVRNGTVRGFVVGVRIDGEFAQGAVIERLRVEGNSAVGIQAAGRGTAVRHNTIIGSGSHAEGIVCAGILVNRGSGVHITDNEILDVQSDVASGIAVGIDVFGATGTVVERNVVENVLGNVPKGIYFVTSDGSSAVGNRVYNVTTGIQFDSTGIYKDNTVGHAAVPFQGGTAAGATNFSF
jgi:parallel beta helix pectate lyase-like protein